MRILLNLTEGLRDFCDQSAQCACFDIGNLLKQSKFCMMKQTEVRPERSSESI